MIAELSFDFNAGPLAVDRLEWVGDAFLQEIVRSLICTAVISAVETVAGDSSRRAAIRRNVTEFVGIAVSNEVLSLAFDQIGMWFASPQLINGIIQQKLKTKADMIEACIGKLVMAHVCKASDRRASLNAGAGAALSNPAQTVDELITIILQIAATHLRLPQLSASQPSSVPSQAFDDQACGKAREAADHSMTTALQSEFASFVGSSVARSVCSCGIYKAAGQRNTPGQMTYMRQDLLRAVGSAPLKSIGRSRLTADFVRCEGQTRAKLAVECGWFMHICVASVGNAELGMLWLVQDVCSKAHNPYVAPLEEWLQDASDLGICDMEFSKSHTTAGVVARTLVLEDVVIAELRPATAAGRKRSCSEISVSETLDGEWVDFSLLAEDSDSGDEQASDAPSAEETARLEAPPNLVPTFGGGGDEEEGASVGASETQGHTLSIPRAQKAVKRQRTSSSASSSSNRPNASIVLQSLSRADRELLQRFSSLPVLMTMEQLLRAVAGYRGASDSTLSEAELAAVQLSAEIDPEVLSTRLSKNGKICVALPDGLHRKLVYILCRLYDVRTCGTQSKDGTPEVMLCNPPCLPADFQQTRFTGSSALL